MDESRNHTPLCSKKELGGKEKSGSIEELLSWDDYEVTACQTKLCLATSLHTGTQFMIFFH
jgi:hypothetical protein